MCELTQKAIKENPELLLYNIVFSRPIGVWFTPESIVSLMAKASGMAAYNEKEVAYSLRKWYEEGKLDRSCGYYCVERKNQS